MVFKQTINGNQFVLRADEKMSQEVQILFQIILEIPAEKIRDGFMIEAGFTIFTLSLQNNTYCVKVPDFTGNPFNDLTDDLTLALSVQQKQRSLLRLYNLGGDSCRFDDKIIVAKGALKSDNISLVRDSTCSKGDSGWCVKSLADRECDDYEACYAYQLLTLRPSLIKILALPYEYIAIFESNKIKAIVNERNENLMDTIGVEI